VPDAMQADDDTYLSIAELGVIDPWRVWICNGTCPFSNLESHHVEVQTSARDNQHLATSFFTHDQIWTPGIQQRSVVAVHSCYQFVGIQLLDLRVPQEVLYRASPSFQYRARSGASTLLTRW
jgi:hypothetical protein